MHEFGQREIVYVARCKRDALPPLFNLTIGKKYWDYHNFIDFLSHSECHLSNFMLVSII